MGASMVCRGVRGATDCRREFEGRNSQGNEAVIGFDDPTKQYRPSRLASAIFTVTKDLNAEFPARRCPAIGWLDVSAPCGYGGSSFRFPGPSVSDLLHWNTTKAQKEIQHVYNSRRGPTAPRS